jgi:hypothetical protein
MEYIAELISVPQSYQISYDDETRRVQKYDISGAQLIENASTKMTGW